MKIDWKRKLSSRKFWVLCTGVISALLVIFKVDPLVIEQVLALVAVLGLMAVYIFIEGKIDTAREEAKDDCSK